MPETQRITETDVANGRIRVPRGSKGLFPRERTEIVVVLKGSPLPCAWDPRLGPDKERSGVIAVGKENMRSLPIGERLTIVREGESVRLA